MGAVFVLILVLATLAILVFGLITFVRGGEFNRKYSNKIMRARLGMQFVAVIVIVIVAWLTKGG